MGMGRSGDRRDNERRRHVMELINHVFDADSVGMVPRGLQRFLHTGTDRADCRYVGA